MKQLQEQLEKFEFELKAWDAELDALLLKSRTARAKAQAGKHKRSHAPKAKRRLSQGVHPLPLFVASA